MHDVDALPPSLGVAEQAIMRLAATHDLKVTANYRTSGTATYLDFKKLHKRSGLTYYMNVNMEGDRYHCYFQVAADRYDMVFDDVSKMAKYFVIGHT